MNASFSLGNQDCSGHRGCSIVPPATSVSKANRSNSARHDINLQMIPGLASTKVEPDSSLRQLARGKVQQGDFAAAIEILTQLIRRHPTDANDYNNRGLVYFQSGQYDKAIADYNKAIKLNPDLAAAYNNRANYYAAKKELAKAIADYDRAIDLNPVYVRALINQGITFRDLKLYDLAIENFDFALRLGQLKGNIWAERGRTYHLLGDWNYAIADYRRALEHLTDNRRRQQIQTWLNELLNPSHS